MILCYCIIYTSDPRRETKFQKNISVRYCCPISLQLLPRLGLIKPLHSTVNLNASQCRFSTVDKLHSIV